MSDDRPSGGAQEGRHRSWLERIGQILQQEPKDREDIRELLQEAQQRQIIDRDALHMMDGVLDVAEMQVRDVMIPRSQMEVVERDARLSEILPIIIESAHSRFPVIGENRDEVVGILLAKDLLPYVSNDDAPFNIRDVLRPALFVPESKRLNVMLREFRTNRNHLAVVVDEYGGVAGVVTIEDVLEQIVGEIEDEYDIDEDEGDILPAGDGHYTVRALTSIEDFNDHFRSQLSDEEFDTLGGLVMGAFGRMPKRGEVIDISGFRVTVQRADSRRIHLLDVVALTSEDTVTVPHEDAEPGSGPAN